ncbi:MAG: hypothetical protein P1V20_24900 [Verrucomicrobiales bacterium]|nr:hypothetical protein [Verrucomicrobiales bacterium]
MRSTVSTLIIAAVAGISLFAVAEEAKNEPIKAGEFSFSYAAPWIRQAVTSSMRAGQLTYKQSDENLKNVDVVFFYFGPGGAGGIDANIERWKGQFVGDAETNTEKKTVNGREIVYFTGKGTFEDSMGGPFSGNRVQRKDYSVLAAILPSDGGPAFLKMTGPTAAVEAAREDFIKLAESGLKGKE